MDPVGLTIPTEAFERLQQLNDRFLFAKCGFVHHASRPFRTAHWQPGRTAGAHTKFNSGSMENEGDAKTVQTYEIYHYAYDNPVLSSL